MKTTNKFISIVTLGSFNPAILTPDFLNEQKIFISDEIPKGKTTNVVSNLRYGDIGLIVELERFQVIHENVKDFLKSPIINIAKKYFEVLIYSPITAQGINFNIQLLNYKKENKLMTLLNDPMLFAKKFVENKDSYSIRKDTMIERGECETTVLELKYFLQERISRTISFTKINDEEMVLNYNAEVSQIFFNKNNLRYLHQNFQEICGGFERFVNLFN